MSTEAGPEGSLSARLGFPETAVEVSWNRRLATTAGRAFVRGGRIELNPRLLATVPDQIDSVLVHEAAHVAAFRLFGENIPAHGRHWRSLMRLAGCAPGSCPLPTRLAASTKT